MPLKLYTLRGRHSGKLYYATGFNIYQAAKQLGISFKELILERAELMPTQLPMEAHNETPSKSQPK